MTTPEGIRMTDEEQIEWEEFGEYAAEARACGGDVMTFDEWSGRTNVRADAESRARAIWENGDEDLY
tara:strand:+ start:384 stop:584 length:201 start_codon:yes stop_codon:yes gene_type:complete